MTSELLWRRVCRQYWQ